MIKPLHFCALLLLIVSCRPAQIKPKQQTLVVFAAASLTEPFSEISRQFEIENPDLKVSLVFAGSQQLATQIREGATVDVFASANQAQMDTIIKAGMINESELRYFASNRLMTILPRENPARITTLADLAQPGIRIVMAAAEVPVGKYTLEFLELADRDGSLAPGFKEKVLQNVVSYENDVKAILAKVILGEADAGMVYASDASSGPADRLVRLEIPDQWNILARYPIAPINQSAQPQMADSFIDFVFSAQGQAILAQSGFLQVAP